jgi:hypothetical protein
MEAHLRLMVEPNATIYAIIATVKALTLIALAMILLT